MSQETPWTPGPWQVVDWDEETLGVSGLGRTPLAYLEANDTGNARLIAAAPEMAELLASIATDPGSNEPSDIDYYREPVRRLLARIRGEA